MVRFDPVYSFDVETTDNKLRMVVYKEQVEYICRKERSSALRKYISNGHGRLFNGRLQLHKDHDRITIIAKNEIIGTLSASQLAKLCGA